jgi:hypothetical protein
MFAYFCLQPSELNGVFNFVETTPPPDFLIGKIGSGLMFGLSGVETGSVVKYTTKTEPLKASLFNHK